VFPIRVEQELRSRKPRLFAIAVDINEIVDRSATLSFSEKSRASASRFGNRESALPSRSLDRKDDAPFVEISFDRLSNHRFTFGVRTNSTLPRNSKSRSPPDFLVVVTAAGSCDTDCRATLSPSLVPRATAE
jgi:hypothetical protein